MGVVGKFCETASKVLVGGKMAFTFLAAKGVLVGATQVDEPHRFEVRASCIICFLGGCF